MEIFLRAFQSAGIHIPSDVILKFETYRDLLLRWNQNINLVSRQDEHRIAVRHFLESAGLMLSYPFQDNDKVLDLGTGAGFPGIPLKLVKPQIHLVLVESKKKKVLFLKEAVKCLKLPDVNILAERAEDIKVSEKFDIVISRAVTNLALLLKWSRPFLKYPGGKIIAMKGPRVYEEIKTVQKRCEHIQCSIKPYNPFSEIYPLQDHFLGIIELL